MKLRIIYDNYQSLMKEIRDRAEKGEWNTWSVVKCHLNNGKIVRRLIHTPPNDNQYNDIELRLILPSENAIKRGENYIDIVPSVKKDFILNNSERYRKFAVVMGRWCEILNQYFPQVSEYHVYLKD